MSHIALLAPRSVSPSRAISPAGPAYVLRIPDPRRRQRECPQVEICAAKCPGMPRNGWDMKGDDHEMHQLFSEYGFTWQRAAGLGNHA